MRPAFILLSATLAWSWAIPDTAQQQLACGKREDVLLALFSQYREELRAIGRANQTAVIEVFTSKTGSWAILLAKPGGASRIVNAGEAWEDIPPKGNHTAL